MLRGRAMTSRYAVTRVYGFSYRNLAMKLENVSSTLGRFDAVLMTSDRHCWTDCPLIKSCEMKRLDATLDIANECDNRREREVTEQTSAF